MQDSRGPELVPELVDRLFRHESARIVASLTRAFGASELQLAEDAVQEALIKALRLWPYQGVPESPRAWLARVARNSALDILRRQQNWGRKQEQLLRRVERSAEPAEVERQFGVETQDDELQLLFLCCHPQLARADQVALTLKIAAGLSAEEIGRALLTKRKTVEQRLVRAKRKLRSCQARFEMPSGTELAERLDAVHEVLYLIFNEGYASSTHSDWLRTELCAEAVRLAELLGDNDATRSPQGFALAALFAFQAARFPARIDDEGAPIELEQQNRALWDGRLLRRGLQFFESSAAGREVTRYHLEAEIAAHWVLEERPDWGKVLELYEELRQLNPSPVVEVHHAVALARTGAAREALHSLQQLSSRQQLAEYLPFFVALGEIAHQADRPDVAVRALTRARELSGSDALTKRLSARSAALQASLDTERTSSEESE